MHGLTPCVHNTANIALLRSRIAKVVNREEELLTHSLGGLLPRTSTDIIGDKEEDLLMHYRYYHSSFVAYNSY